HTGDLSAQMLVDAGASHVILGHSERRQDHGETNADVHAKMQAALAQNLTVILCIGESLAQREAGDTLDHLATQLDGSLPKDADVQLVVIAYEPMWAIGTGKIPTLEQIAEVHQFIRSTLGAAASDMPLLYGGSVKASNAAEIFAVPDVDGALVGGASLSAADFSPIVKALDASS
ncbi:MAG: triose-phosphate isomerase, partial [Sedimentitalea sp.]